MSWISDTSELYAGSWLTSAYGGLGILGQNVPSTGSDGEPLLYNDLSLPADNLDEFRLTLTQAPVGLTTFTLSEDSSYYAAGPAGTYSGTVEAFKNGVSYGFSSFSVTLGASQSKILRQMNQSFSGKRLLTTNMVGVRGDSIPSMGTDGPPYAYNDLSLPADAGKLIRGFITTFPTTGTLVANDDTSFVYTGGSGTDSFIYQLWVDDVNVGSATATLNVSATNASLNVTLDASVFNGSASVSASGTITVTLADASFSGSAAVSALTALTVTLADSAASVSASSGNFVSLNTQTADSTSTLSAASGIGTFLFATTENAVFTGFALSIIVSDTQMQTSTADATFIGSAIAAQPALAVFNSTLDDVVLNGSVIGTSNSIASCSIPLDAVTPSASASSLFGIVSAAIFADNSIFTGSSSVTLPTNSSSVNIILDPDYVYMSATGSVPPNRKTNVQVPIPLGVSEDGKIIILI